VSGKILVTGATGKVGSEVVKQLAAKGEAVRAGLHNPDKAADLGWGDKVEIVPFNFVQTATIEAALEGVDRVFLMSPPSQTDSLAMEKTVIDAAKKAGVGHIVKLSAAGVENSEEAPLRQAEKYLEASGIAYTHLRPSWFNQNFSTGQAASIKQGAFYIPAADGKTGFIDTRDIAAVGVAAFTQEGHANKAYTLTGSEALDHYQVADIISKATGREVKYMALSDEQFRATTTAEGWPPAVIEMMSQLYGMIRQGWTATVTPTVSQVLDRAPISFEQFAQDYASVWE